MNKYQVAFALLVLVCGCGQTGPLDDAAIIAQARTEISGATLEYPGHHRVELLPDDYDLVHEMIASLAPIKSAKIANLNVYDYRLTYFAGMNPTMIDVKLGGGSSFEYQWGKYVYQGGDAARFRASIADIHHRAMRPRDKPGGN